MPTVAGGSPDPSKLLVLLFLESLEVGEGETDDVNAGGLVGDERTFDEGAVLAPKERERLGQAVEVGEVDGDVVPPPCVAFGCGLTDAERLALFVTVAVALGELLAVPLYDKMHIAVETMGPAPVELLTIARTRPFIESET